MRVGESAAKPPANIPRNNSSTNRPLMIAVEKKKQRGEDRANQVRIEAFIFRYSTPQSTG